jgi:hypothetical protein
MFVDVHNEWTQDRNDRAQAKLGELLAWIAEEKEVLCNLRGALEPCNYENMCNDFRRGEDGVSLQGNCAGPWKVHLF